MPKICYKPSRFSSKAMDIITKANAIIEEYTKQGYNLTLRQLYYQFVARDLFPDDWLMSYVGSKWVKDLDKGTKNNGPNYTKLQGLISEARTAGLVDWLAIVDRTRGMVKNNHWTKPSEIIKSAADNYAVDKWFNQPYYVEVWVEKDALAGVLQGACSKLDVPFFACRGYTSSSEIWVAAQRLADRIAVGKKVIIVHLGDHDPSGIDMSRDIKDRLSLFSSSDIPVLRVALNMSQIRRYNPPPNFAKTTDARYESYRAKYGDQSWELDALSPNDLVEIVNRAVLHYRDENLWNESVKLEERGRKTLNAIVQEFPQVVSLAITEFLYPRN